MANKSVLAVVMSKNSMSTRMRRNIAMLKMLGYRVKILRIVTSRITGCQHDKVWVDECVDK